jgi:hypothetical protein
VILYKLLAAYKRVGLPEEFRTARPNRLRFLVLNTVGKVLPMPRNLPALHQADRLGPRGLSQIRLSFKRPP